MPRTRQAPTNVTERRTAKKRKPGKGMQSGVVKDKKTGQFKGSYDPKYAHIAGEACAQFGARKADLAKIFNVTRDAVYKWMRRHSEFAEAIREGTDYHTLHRVERTLTEKACGYNYEERTVEEIAVESRDGEDKVKLPGVKTTIHTKYARPDTTAIMFILQNRAPERWKNVRHIEAGGAINVKHTREDVEDISKGMDEQTAYQIYKDALRTAKTSMRLGRN